jgi:methylglutaconyl-CoA hydratase
MSVLIDCEKGIGRVTLNKPDRRNAFDAAMVEQIRQAFETLGKDRSTRVIVLAASGRIFCAGADLHWMGPEGPGRGVNAKQDAEQLLSMLRTIDECPCPVIGRVQGAAYGGGLGLLAVCDTVVAGGDAIFAFSEVRLGLVPAIIAPFVLRKTGESFARRFCLSGESFSAATARMAGLIHEVAEPSALEARVAALAERTAVVAPRAARDTKALLRRLTECSTADDWKACVDANVEARRSAEAREGIRAFQERRAPAWAHAEGGTEERP